MKIELLCNDLATCYERFRQLLIQLVGCRDEDHIKLICEQMDAVSYKIASLYHEIIQSFKELEGGQNE